LTGAALGRRPAAPRRADAAALSALVLLAAAPYAGAARLGFAFDDLLYVARNGAIHRGFTPESLRWAFTSFHMGNWHPLTWLSHMADVSLFGVVPGPHHLVNVALHAAVTAALFLVLRRLGLGAGRGFAVAALFGVHPLHVESVAWISERKDLLAGLFFMLALLAWVRYCRRPGPGAYAAAAALLAAGLLAKAMLVTLPPLLLLLDFWPLGRMAPAPGGAPGRPAARRVLALALEKAPLLALAAGAAAVALIAQRAYGALATTDSVPMGLRWANALLSYPRYLGDAIWPHALSPFYPFPEQLPPLAQLAGAGALLAALTLGTLLAARRLPYLAVGWLWFLGTLVPVIGIVQVGSQARADRYMYLPLVGLLIAAVSGAGDLLTRVRAPRGAAAALAALLALAAGVAAHGQAGYWKDDTTLFQRAVDLQPDNWLSRGNLGLALYKQRRYAEALPHMLESVRLYPGYYQGHLNLGLALSALGRKEEALASFARAARIAPNGQMAYTNMAFIYVEQRRKQDALAMYRTLQRLDPPSAARVLAMIQTLP
jgi:tetratricopeptide (TPR) repeat protein